MKPTIEEIKNVSESCVVAGTMSLLSVAHIEIVQYPGDYYYVYHLYFSKALLLAVTNFHAFSGIRNGEKILVTPSMMNEGDKIWVDISAFIADSSFFKKSNKQMVGFNSVAKI